MPKLNQGLSRGFFLQGGKVGMFWFALYLYTLTNWVYKIRNRILAFWSENSFSFTNIFKIERNEVR